MNRYIPAIDGLRALAVLAVLLFHLEPSWLPGGFTGVDVFFVISGFVVSKSLASRDLQHLPTFLYQFYARRVVRIFPALFSCLVLTTFFVVLFVPKAWLSGAGESTGLSAFFGVSNFALVFSNDGYFSPRVDFNAFTHTWSLGVEEQFYLLFPPLFFWVSRTGALKNRRGHLAHLALPVLVILSCIYCAFTSRVASERAFYFLPSRFWELGAGALLYRLHLHCPQFFRGAWLRITCSFLGLFLVLIGFALAKAKLFPLPWGLCPVMGACLLVSASAQASGAAHNKSAGIIFAALEHPFLLHLGRVSYSLYLWHWPVFVLLRWTIGLTSAVHQLIAISLSFLLAELSYFFIEKPLRKRGREQAPRIIVLRYCITLVLACAFSLSLFKLQPWLSLSKTRDRQVWVPHEWQLAGVQPRASQLTERHLFALGDSHVGAYRTLFGELTQRHGLQVSRYFTGGCGVANLLEPAAQRPECTQVLQQTIAAIEGEAKPGDIVFLASLRVVRLADQWASEGAEAPRQPSEQERALALEEAHDLIERFLNQGLSVVIDAPKPIFHTPAFRCADWFNAMNPVCSHGWSIEREFLESHRAPALLSLSTLKQQLPRLSVWDPFYILCPQEQCSSFDGEQPLFRDGDHLSVRGNRILYQDFERMLFQSVNEQEVLEP